MKNSAKALSTVLKEKRLTIAFAESVTCGLLAHGLGSTSKTSEFLKGSIICYDEIVKTGLLKVSKQLIDEYTAESQAVTDTLVRNLSGLIKADIYAAITGLAASGGSETNAKPVGTVFYSVLFKRKLYKKKQIFKGSPLQIKKKACSELYKFIVKKIN
ncbi:MAG: CinA family protein [Bacteroidota bacterium]